MEIEIYEKMYKYRETLRLLKRLLNLALCYKYKSNL